MKNKKHYDVSDSPLSSEAIEIRQNNIAYLDLGIAFKKAPPNREKTLLQLIQSIYVIPSCLVVRMKYRSNRLNTYKAICGIWNTVNVLKCSNAGLNPFMPSGFFYLNPCPAEPGYTLLLQTE